MRLAFEGCLDGIIDGYMSLLACSRRSVNKQRLEEKARGKNRIWKENREGERLDKTLADCSRVVVSRLTNSPEPHRAPLNPGTQLQL